RRLRTLTDTPESNTPESNNPESNNPAGDNNSGNRNGHRPTLARLGGDEFALLLPRTTPQAAHHLAHRIHAALASPYHLHDRELHLTASIGLLADTPTHNPTHALRDADLALHHAKTTGKNRTTRFTPDLRTTRLHHIHLAAALRHATTRGELTLAYQPIIDLHTGAPTAVEALLRWTPTSTGTPIDPDTFIPLAEETGLITDLGHWTLTRALTDARPWHQAHGTAV
ncbi:EAL domain-containing protein, partial [Planomonospora corallina]